MKKFLYVSAFFPSKNAGHAGGRVAFENLIKLRSEGYVDSVVCTSEDVVLEIEPETMIIRQDKFAFVYYLVRNFKNISWQSLLAAPVIHTRLNQEAEYLIADLLRERGYDEVFVDFTQCLMLVSRAIVRSGVSVSPKISACLHDIFAQRMIRSHRLTDVALTGLVCRQEKEFIQSLDGITVLNAKDGEILKNLYSVAFTEITIKSFSPPDWCASVDRVSNGVDLTKIIFFGNFDRFENSSAAKWFVENAMDDICSAIPDATLILLGTGSDRLATQIGSSNVVGIGFIDDPSPYFSCCGCAIAPLFEGAGVKFKVLEALACGVPVIGTAVACEGIEEQEMLFQAEGDTFAAETIRVLQVTKKFQS